MRIGDVKAQALKLMFVSYIDDVRAENVDDLMNQENYRPYLLGMIGSLNRCLADIEVRRVLPVRKLVLDVASGIRSRSSRRFDLSAVKDFYDVCRLVAEGADSYDGDAPYFMEGDTLVLRGVDEETDYTLLYYPKLGRLEEYANNTEELDGVTEEIAALIPYYIKGDLFREDEPNEAGEARNWYESGMAALERPRSERQGRVQAVYRQVDV